MRAIRRGWLRALVVVAPLAIAGCAGMSMADVLASTGLPGVEDRVSGEVRRVDQRRRTIELSGWYGGREVVRYDSRTRVSYGRRSYPVDALERGDRVSVSVQHGRNGDRYARHIVVERSVRDGTRDRDRRGGWDDRARVRWLEGRVERVDHRGGWFDLQSERGREVTVLVPSHAESRTVRAFRRLRRGAHVRLEAEWLGDDRVELIRFR